MVTPKRLKKAAYTDEFLMDFGLDKRATRATLWMNGTKQGCSMTLERKSIMFGVQDFFNEV